MGRPPVAVEVQLEPGSRRTFVANVVPVVGERGGGVVLVLHDITDLRRADQVRRDFVANVSHELRTPLTAIRGYVEALLDGPSPPEETQRFLAIIARHADRMERLVRDLLRLARLDAGQETLEFADCSVAALVAAAGHELDALLASREQHLQTTVAPDATLSRGRSEDAPLPAEVVRLVHRLNNQLGVILANAELLEHRLSDDALRARAEQVVTGTMEAISTAQQLRRVAWGSNDSENTPV